MAEKPDSYTGPVCYADGWHWSVVKDDAGGERPHRQLVLEDDGSYRLATDADASWHDRKHQRFAAIVPEGGQGGLEVSAEEFEAVKEFLEGRRDQ